MKLKYTPEAIRDLQSTKAYIGDVLHNPEAARRITKQVLDLCGSLKSHPFLGISLQAKTGTDSDLRYLVCENHLIFYRVESEWILIARILDGRTDYLRILFR